MPLIIYVLNMIIRRRAMEEYNEMTKEEMQRFLIKEALRGTSEIEAYRNLMEILGIEFPVEKSDKE